MRIRLREGEGGIDWTRKVEELVCTKQSWIRLVCRSSVETEDTAEEEPTWVDMSRRSEEDRRTRAKMRKLQEDMERIRIERGRGRVKETAPSSSGGAGLPVESRGFQRNARQSAPEDTSAKESSAGETEAEEAVGGSRRLVPRGAEASAAAAERRSTWAATAAGASSSEGPGAPLLALARKEKGVSSARGRHPRVPSSSSEPESSGKASLPSSIRRSGFFRKMRANESA